MISTAWLKETNKFFLISSLQVVVRRHDNQESGSVWLCGGSQACRPSTVTCGETPVQKHSSHRPVTTWELNSPDLTTLLCSRWRTSLSLCHHQPITRSRLMSLLSRRPCQDLGLNVPLLAWERASGNQ